MGFAVEEGGEWPTPSHENKLIALEPFATLCENHALPVVGKVVGLRRNPIMWLGDEMEQQITTSDQLVN